MCSAAWRPRPPRRPVRTRKRQESLARPLHHVPELVWTRGHVHVLDAQWAQRVADRVDHGRAGRDRAVFPDALDAKDVGRARRDGVVEAHGWDLADAGDVVVEQLARLELATVFVVDDLLIQRL